MSLEDAASVVHDGDRVGIGGSTMSRTPMGLIWAVIRAGRTKLSCSRSIVSSDGDLLFASGSWEISPPGQQIIAKMASQLAADQRRDLDVLAVGLFALITPLSAQDVKDGKGKRPDFIPADYDDYQNMLDQLGIQKVRKGRDARVKDTSDEATANPFKDSMPDPMIFKDGKIAARHVGVTPEATLRADLQRVSQP